MRIPVKSLIAILTFLLMSPVAASALECGDVDADGVVAASDALRVLRKAVGDPSALKCEQAQTTGDLEERVATLEAMLAHFTVEGDNLVLSGMNLQVVNGEGGTGTVNGLGNVIIGYDEATINKHEEILDTKTGSHNLIIGAEHTYTHFGAIVAGEDNASEGPGASVLGGHSNLATGENAVVIAGTENEANGHASVVVAGNENITDEDAEETVIAAGAFNRTFALDSFVGGGLSNHTRGFASSITGGEFNRTEFEKTSVTGGHDNVALAQDSTVSGGAFNRAEGFASVVSGGTNRSIDGAGSWRGGGLFSAQ
jgi:hypothetical protein